MISALCVVRMMISAVRTTRGSFDLSLPIRLDLLDERIGQGHVRQRLRLLLAARQRPVEELEPERRVRAEGSGPLEAPREADLGERCAARRASSRDVLVDVVVEVIHLPLDAIGVSHPELVLVGVAAARVHLLANLEAAPFRALEQSKDGVAGLDLESRWSTVLPAPASPADRARLIGAKVGRNLR
jgi:hypothetical protein